MDDIAPELLEQISKAFSENMAKSEPLARLLATIQNGSTSYADAQAYADLLGGCLADALGMLNSDILPDGRLYYNIAERLLTPFLEKTHTLASDAAVAVQTAINTNAGIGIKAQRALFDTDRVKGIVDKVSDAPIFDDVRWMLREPISNFTMASVDNTLKANIDFQGKAGLSPRIIRKAEFKCCAWCRQQAGTYTYPDLPREVYQRHERCRCTVEYDPGTGKRQNVHTKTTRSTSEAEEREKRIALSKKELLPKQQIVAYNSKNGSSPDLTLGTAAQIAQNPRKLAEYTPAELKKILEDEGYTVNPLGGGNFKHITFEEGGGFRTTYGGDQYLQYHPKARSHHEGAYYKLSSGKEGKQWYELNGEPKAPGKKRR